MSSSPAQQQRKPIPFPLNYPALLEHRVERRMLSRIEIYLANMTVTLREILAESKLRSYRSGGVLLGILLCKAIIQGLAEFGILFLS